MDKYHFLKKIVFWWTHFLKMTERKSIMKLLAEKPVLVTHLCSNLPIVAHREEADFTHSVGTEVNLKIFPITYISLVPCPVALYLMEIHLRVFPRWARAMDKGTAPSLIHVFLLLFVNSDSKYCIWTSYVLLEAVSRNMYENNSFCFLCGSLGLVKGGL